MKACLVGLSGGIGSGKTEVSRRLAAQLSWGMGSFGDRVREVARDRGLPETRDVLQEIGESLITSRLEEFCATVLSRAGWTPSMPLVVDGIRHLEVIEQLRHLVAPLPALHVHLETPDEVRANRLEASRPSDAEQLSSLDLHSTERQVKTSLRDAADLVLDGTEAPDMLVAAIVRWLGQDRAQPVLRT